MLNNAQRILIMSIDIVPFNKKYAFEYECERRLILNAAQDNLIEIHHIGSTSVEHLAAKPVIDIIANVYDIKLFKTQVKDIAYEARGELGIPFREYFRKDKKINLHVYENYNIEVELNLVFRDFLRNNADARLKYQKLKYELAAKENAATKDTSLYTFYNLGKDEFIRNAIKQTSFNGLRLMFVNHYIEQQKFATLYNGSLPNKNNLDKEIKFILYQGMDIIAAIRVFLINDYEVLIDKAMYDSKLLETESHDKMMSLIHAWCKKHKLSIKL